MSEKGNRGKVNDPAIVQRAVVLQILGEHREERWSPAELERELSDLQPGALQEALLSLERAGVLERSGETVRASQAVRRLDELDLIAV